jgi:hypothetical protein
MARITAKPLSLSRRLNSYCPASRRMQHEQGLRTLAGVYSSRPVHRHVSLGTLVPSFAVSEMGSTRVIPDGLDAHTQRGCCH